MSCSFIKEQFGKVPTIGWQLDPFGHSATHAALMCGLLGFDGLFFGRADYQVSHSSLHSPERPPILTCQLMWQMLVMDQAGNPDCQLPADAYMLAVLLSCCTCALLLVRKFCNGTAQNMAAIGSLSC